jgi:hypothetical protein
MGIRRKVTNLRLTRVKSVLVSFEPPVLRKTFSLGNDAVGKYIDLLRKVGVPRRLSLPERPRYHSN